MREGSICGSQSHKGHDCDIPHYIFPGPPSLYKYACSEYQQRSIHRFLLALDF